MSYILDALKRADAERERGAAPGLHTRHQLPADGPGTPRSARNVGWSLAGGLLLVVAGLFFWLARAPDTPNAQPSAPPAVAAPNLPAPAAPVVAAAPPEVLRPLVPAPHVVTKAPKVQALPLRAASATQALAAASASADQAATAAAAAPDAKPVNPAAAPAPVAKPIPAALPLLAELPQDLRGQIPKITITGSVYSASPAQRLLLINNLVLPQGGVVESDLKLEEIQPRSSVFIFKGTRFRVLH